MSEKGSFLDKILAAKRAELAAPKATRSAALVSDHYGARLRSGEFWRKLLTGKVDVAGAAREALGHLARARAQRRRRDDGPAVHDLPTRLARVLATSRLPIRLQISGRDLTAAEFEIAMKAAGVDGAHTKAMRLEDADHTFSSAVWRNSVATAVTDWLQKVESGAGPPRSAWSRAP